MRPRLIICEAWEAAAMMAGKMTQKRVPLALWRIPPGPGALVWVQEPFVEWFQVGNPAHCDLGYRADAGPGELFAPMADHLKNLNVRTCVRDPKEMRAGDSRLTLELTADCRRTKSPFQGYVAGDREREGFEFLHKSAPHLSPAEAWWEFWRRRYDDYRPIITLTFRVHKQNVGKLLKERMAHAA